RPMGQRYLQPDELRRLMRSDGEVALLDARGELAFSKEHLLLASCLPLSRIEVMIADLVPRRTTPLVWCDGGDELADRAAQRVREIGYSDIAVLQGGTAAWRLAGLPLYSGVHVPSKALAE